MSRVTSSLALLKVFFYQVKHIHREFNPNVHTILSASSALLCKRTKSVLLIVTTRYCMSVNFVVGDHSRSFGVNRKILKQTKASEHFHLVSSTHATHEHSLNISILFVRLITHSDCSV